ncbi:16S rRNA (cytidine(1402)-2'-O)-methyltransferase [Herbaspirillum sp. RTI4]|uniref:16S rRNA (cytidine(1402)-2'-O)-methyltransferase n=1 Tax=Herbaspirillum sp. RTI4 TaxID=3048640 RepID=UPI002AB3D042|nr:16S rRNA (cytidine(1402)-2'-O)-methyltransferase [Herbaspirillum sp. RTI4]MDY7577444.1 16S rRNA (cytidine(1402)-2'-O)-methyltransferase [Herbaspirillum sp. RTI4]MEA9981720.1 16S rRNA (cytidine(1402)-2'-O)-methyltransferase [Herbaspirillum sp. RTI4]
MSQTSPPLLTAMPVMHEVAQQTYPVSALYVLATPIGNVCDITLRGLHMLSLADAIACEDTRNTAHLLNRYGVSKPLLAAHEHNEREVAEKIVARLQAGERIVLVSDAGTPAISDPGARIVDAVLHAGLRVIPLPGASAGIAALSASGLLNDQFHFIGFLSPKAGARDKQLERLATDTATLVLYEAPHRIVDTIDALLKVFGPLRQIVFARELTKLFETIHRCPLSEAPGWLSADANHQRGEFVLLIEGAPQQADNDDVEALRVLRILLAELPVKQAATLAAQLTGQKKNALYQQALALRDADDAAAEQG